MELLDGFAHQAGLIDFRQAHVYVQHMGAGILLGNALPQQVGDVVVPQRLLEFRLACGIDALPDNHRLGAEFHPADARGDQSPGGGGEGLAPQARAGSGHFRDVLRGGAAASAHNPGAFPGDFTHPAGEFLGPHIVIGCAVPLHGKPRVGVDHQRQAGKLPQLGHQSRHLLGPQPAVEADGVGAQAFQNSCRHADVPAGQKLAVPVKGHGDKHRQVGVLLGGQQRGFGLVDVAHGFQQDPLGPGAAARLDHLPKGGDSFLKIQLPQGAEKLPCGADVQKYRAVAAGLHRLQGVFHPGGDHLLHGVAASAPKVLVFKKSAPASK